MEEFRTSRRRDQTTPAAVLAAADDPDATRKKRRVCLANFYNAELSFTKGLKDQATRLYRLAASDCPHSFIEWDAANAELKALGVAHEQVLLGREHLQRGPGGVHRY